MNINISTLLLSTCLLAVSATHADKLTSCAAKKNEIETQLKDAQKHGHHYRVQGLQKALKENITHCDDTELKQKHLKKIQEKELKVQERQQELKIAKAKNNHIKIAKQQKKLTEAQVELNEAKQALK